MPTLSFTNSSDSYTVTGAGDYELYFLDGADTLVVNGGTSTLAQMGAGDDLVRLKSGPAVVYGNGGADRFEIWTTGITADGGPDADLFQIIAGSNHTLYGQGGSDRFNFFANTSGILLLAGGGDDILDGNNYVISGAIHGEGGRDYFIDFNGSGGVELYGGVGNDTYRADPVSPATFIENADEGTDTVEIARGIGYVLPANIENLAVKNLPGSTADPAALSGNGLDNTITGSDNVETIHGLAGNDRLFGLGGNDTLQGGSGNDRLNGGDGNDTLIGGTGNDLLKGGAGDDVMRGAAGDDTYYVDSLSDQVIENFDEGIDLVHVSVDGYTLPDNVENAYVLVANSFFSGNDLDNVIIGAGGNDTLNGGGGNDTIKGGAGNDTLSGGFGDDVLGGGPGSDFLWGFYGADTLKGGTGDDIFKYFSAEESAAGSPDWILDFTSVDGAGGDYLDLSSIDANVNAAFDQAFMFNGVTPAANSIWYTVVNNGDGSADYTLYGDVNGDTIAEFELNVHVTNGVFYLDDIGW